MSTDDSISEDVSSSGPLSHCHVGGYGDGGKGSETSLVSSEGTSASGLAVSEERHTASKTTGGTVESRPIDITPACDKIRSLCLGTKEVLECGKNLPFINPSSLETLQALVQEIQSSGETDPEIWKDCEGRWLHLFQLVEKQYQEQILAQQAQYQCQIPLIQDEIKALVQLQNRQACVQPHTDFSPTPLIKTAAASILAHRNVISDNGSPPAPAQSLFGFPSPDLQGAETGEKQETTVLSSGYRTLSTLEMSRELSGFRGEFKEESQTRKKPHWSSDLQEDTETPVARSQQEFVIVEKINPSLHQRRTTGQPLTSWAQRQKLRPKKNGAGQASSEFSSQNPGHQEEPHSKQHSQEGADSQEQHQLTGPLSSTFPLRRSDSLMSAASGLTYWRLNENELYRPLPDSLDSGAVLLQEASMNLTPSQQHQRSLKEIYKTKQRSDSRHSDWEGSPTSSPLSPQLSSLDPAANMKHSDQTSGFTSPSHFSSPSFATQPHFNHRVETPVTPDSMVECNPGDTDCISDTSSLSVAGPSPSKVQSLWESTSKPLLSTSQENALLFSHTANQQHRANNFTASVDEGDHTHTSTMMPSSASDTNLRPVLGQNARKASVIEDPIVLSLLRQKLREKYSRHVADLKAYYESEIQTLRDKLNLPQDLETNNRALTERCRDLEKALAEANSRIQELEATNGALENKLAEWSERYAVAGATIKSLQKRLEEGKHSGKEKDTLAALLKNRVRHLEEAVQKSSREADEKEARKEREHKMLQDLLKEYDSLIKKHEGSKNKLVSVENKLVDANDHISELKRVIFKLESQVKQLEHENQARARYASSNTKTQPSGAGLFHHPDLLLSPSKSNPEPDVTCRKSPAPLSDHMNSGMKSSFQQTNVYQKPLYTFSDQPSRPGSSVDFSSAGGSWRCASPPECEQSHQSEMGRTQGNSALTPTMRALIELEETRATERITSQKTTVGFVDRRNKELLQDQSYTQADRDTLHPGSAVESRTGEAKGHNRAERAPSLLRPQRSLSPEGNRSSSLPPSQPNLPPSTPTKRETLLQPLSAKCSPKRCPTENYSTAFGHMMPREEHLKRIDNQGDQRRHSFHSSSPRKRLQFTSTDREDDIRQPRPHVFVNPPEGNSQQGWEEKRSYGGSLQDSHDDLAPLSLNNLNSLAEAEKLFDELTQEKLQTEAALSRIPLTGGRSSLQTRSNQVALENNLERLNRQLGSIRMILKRFHVLPSSANI
ncbi:M-phase phosphoprotein 9 isoform X2 [Cynoglossus semilaevis]|uniref:M-phase phosphoprotein 9 isoform X2 n=1 Tax=Cynoglossus semilaevis TaxID=244447 RepID=UPI000D622ED8|nr:M-phase phosphoprotein 9 isoform X2 [Cynoglossus semilaevis]